MPNLEFAWDRPDAVKRVYKTKTDRRCSIDGCSRPHLARGWCGRHYYRWSRNGDPLKGWDREDSVPEGFVEKPCRECGAPKPAGSGRALCDACREISKQKRTEYQAKQARITHLKTKYGISIEEYLALAEAQGGLCAICRKKPGKKFKTFGVDHDHRTGQVRGLLCTRCNIGLAFIEDDAYFPKALQYLKQGGGSPRQI